MTEELLKVSEGVKAAGTDFFKKGEYEVAQKKYNYVMGLLEDQTSEEAAALKRVG